MMMVVGFVQPEWGMQDGGEVRLVEVWLCQDEGWWVVSGWGSA